jgi:hypothetical protein
LVVSAIRAIVAFGDPLPNGVSPTSSSYLRTAVTHCHCEGQELELKMELEDGTGQKATFAEHGV